MAELKEMDRPGGLSYFEWNCGHQLNQTQQCPVCASEHTHQTMIDRVEAFDTQIEKRGKVLGECRELLSNLCAEIYIDLQSSIGIKLTAIQIKINEICPRSKPFAHLTPDQVNTLKNAAKVWDSIIGWLDQPGIPGMEE